MTQQQGMRMLAYDWHGGQDSPLYSFASTGGVVHTQEHREKLVAEVQADIDWCDANQSTDEAGDRVSLGLLLAFVQAAPLKTKPAGFPGR
jgi:hypothetical protein